MAGVIGVLPRSVHGDTFYLATSFFRQGKWQKALDAIDQKQKSEGETSIAPYLRFIQGSCFEKLDRTREAIAAFEALVQNHPRSSYAQNAQSRIVEILEDQHAYDSLIPKLKAWIETREHPLKSRERWISTLARILVANQQIDEAIEFLARSAPFSSLETLFQILSQANRLESYSDDLEKRGLDAEPQETNGAQTAGAAPGTPAGGFLESELDRERVLGGLALLRGEWDRAHRYLTPYLDRHPEDISTLTELTKLARATRHLEAAESLAQRLVAQPPGSASHLNLLGSIQHALGHPEEARRTWSRILELKPADPQNHLMFSRALSDHNMALPAIEVLKQARTALHRPGIFTEELSALYSSIRSYGDACQEMLESQLHGFGDGKAGERIVELARINPQAKDQVLGVLLKFRTRYPTTTVFYRIEDDVLRLDNDAEAIEALIQDLVKALEGQYTLLLRLARDFATENRDLEARRLLLSVLPRLEPPALWEFSLELARLHRQVKDPTRALDVALSLDRPDVFPVFRVRALELAGEILLYDQLSTDRARDVYEGLLEQFGQNANREVFTLNLARCHIGSLHLDDARKLLEGLSAQSPGPSSADLEFELARLDLLQGRIEDAQEKLNSLVSSQPQSALANEALQLLVFITDHKAGEIPDITGQYFQMSIAVEFRQVDQYRERLRQIDPEAIPPPYRGDFHWLAARVARIEGRYDAAIEALDALAEVDPGGPLLQNALQLKAEILDVDLHRSDLAREVLEEFLLMFPDDLAADEIRERLIRGDDKSTPAPIAP